MAKFRISGSLPDPDQISKNSSIRHNPNRKKGIYLHVQGWIWKISGMYLYIYIYIYIYKRRKRETRKGKMKQNKEKKEKGLMKEKQRYNYLLHLYWDAMYKTGLPRSWRVDCEPRYARFAIPTLQDLVRPRQFKIPVLNMASYCITEKMKYVVFSTCWTKLLTTVLIKHLL